MRQPNPKARKRITQRSTDMRNTDQERNVVPLQGRDIPRDQTPVSEGGNPGSPAFESLEQIQSVFTDDEIVIMVNRAIFQAEYQRDHHKNYSAKVRERERPYKEMAKRLFPHISWVKLTPEQINDVFDAVHRNVLAKQPE